MKVLDVELFREGLKRNVDLLSRQRAEIEAVFNSVYGLVTLDDALKGQGGDAIRTFYAECHLPFLQFFMTFENQFTEVLTSMDDALSSLEPNTSGFIRESFLEGEVEQGLEDIAQLTESLTDEANSIMQQVSDIVSLPKLDDSEVQEGVRNAKIKRDDTITALHEFDENQTTALGAIERDLNTMETWLSDIEGLFKSGLTDVNFPVEQWAFISSQNNLWTDLAYRTMPLGMRNTPGSIESTTPFSYTLPFDDGNLMTVEPAINACVVPTPAPENTGTEIAKGVGAGLYDAGKDFVTGIWDFIVNPIESVKSIVYAVSHPVETYTYLETAITDSYERDVINGDAYSRSRWFSYAAGTVATSVVGTKGAGALTKTSVATTTSVVQNTTLQSQRLMNMFPYGPQSKLPRLGDVPYNVLNGPVIRNQVLSKVKATSKNASILKSPAAVIKEKITAVQAQLAKGAIEVGKVVDQTITNTKNVMSQGPKFAFASDVIKPTTTNTHVARNPGKDMVSKVEGVNIDGKNVVKGTGEVTPKKKTVPDWLKERWEAGNNFNKENRPRYPYNEVELEVKEVGGKKYVVDSYAPNKEIVSRKFTQLNEVQEKTAKSYLNEITKKYPDGSKISNGTFNPKALKGGRLKGELILEVPVQNKPIPQTILDEATKNRIIIRDINGKEYN